MNKYKLVETKDIKKIPKILREKSKEITEITPELLDLAKQMKKIMKENKGVGISAIQVGVPVRMLVVKNCGQDMIFINPDIIRMSRHEVVYSEGCLSFPEVFREISRPEKIKVKAKNENFEDLEIEAEGLVARTLEHEIDHLNGIVFLDRVGD
ncbi:MAG TPA: peptide deformylase [Patescibacteria group bacterium]|nr:peptide deformylase [Patescibacteria group bacterium]